MRHKRSFLKSSRRVLRRWPTWAVIGTQMNPGASPLIFHLVRRNQARAEGKMSDDVPIEAAGGAVPAPDYTPGGGPRLTEFLDGLPLPTCWIHHHRVVWQTGQQNAPEGQGPEAETHRSAFIAAVALVLDIYLLPLNHGQELLDDAPPLIWARPEADNAARRKNFHLVAAFRRQFVLNGTHAEYDRIDALKLSQCRVRSWKKEFRPTSHRTAAVARPRSR
jgi:hypothetical protein